MATSKLDILVQVATRGTEKIKGVSQDLDRLDKSSTSTSSKLKMLGTAALGVGAAVGGMAIAAKQGYEALKQGAELELSRDRFDRLTQSIGTTADAMLGKLRDATRGLVSDAELVDSASQIISLGLADTEDGVVRLANLVSQLGWDMQQVIMTFANNSKMRLDALGLSVEDVEKKAKALEEQGYSMDEAFDLAVIQAGEEKLALLGSSSESTAGRLQKLEVAVTNVKDAFLLMIAASDGADAAITHIEQQARQLNAYREALERGIITQEGWVELQNQIYQAHGRDMTAAEQSALAYKILERRIEDANKALEEKKARLMEVAESASGADVALLGYSSRAQLAGAYSQAASGGVDQLAESLARADSILLGYIGHAEQLEAKNSRIAAKSMRVMSAENFKLSESIQRSTRGLQVQNNELNEYGEAAKDASTSVGGLTETVDETAEAMKRLDAATGDFFMRARDMKEWDPFENFAEILDRAGGNATTIADFLLASGKDAGKINEALGRTAVDAASQGIVDALMRGEISAEDAAAQIGQIQAKFEGNTEAAREFLDTLETPPEDIEVDAEFSAAYDALAAYDAELARPRTISVGADIGGGGSTAGDGSSRPPGREADTGAASGANFIVPPGYHNDSYLVGVTSGEHVQVTPAGRRGSGDTYNIYNYNRQAAAITRAMFQLRRATGIDRRMGVMA